MTSKVTSVRAKRRAPRDVHPSVLGAIRGEVVWFLGGPFAHEYVRSPTNLLTLVRQSARRIEKRMPTQARETRRAAWLLGEALEAAWVEGISPYTLIEVLKATAGRGSRAA